MASIKVDEHVVDLVCKCGGNNIAHYWGDCFCHCYDCGEVGSELNFFFECPYCEQLTALRDEGDCCDEAGAGGFSDEDKRGSGGHKNADGYTESVKMLNVKVWRNETSLPIKYEANNTYTKGGMYCVLVDEVVYKYPLCSIFRVEEVVRK